METPQPMAVEAPTYQSTPSTFAAHAPQVVPAANGGGSDSEDDLPLSKKASNGSKRPAKDAPSSEDEKLLVSYLVFRNGRPPPFGYLVNGQGC